jgi:hypothetical protein
MSKEEESSSVNWLPQLKKKMKTVLSTMHWMTKAQSKIWNQYSSQPATGTNGIDQ